MYDKNNGYFTCIAAKLYDNTSRSSSQNQKCFREICKKNQRTHLMFSNFFSEIVSFMRNVEKYGRARQVTDANIIQNMCFACWISKATGAHLEWSYLFVLHGNNCLAKGLQCTRIYVHFLSVYVTDIRVCWCCPV